MVGMCLSCMSSLVWSAKCWFRIVALSKSSVIGVPSCLISGGMSLFVFLPIRLFKILWLARGSLFLSNSSVTRV